MNTPQFFPSLTAAALVLGAALLAAPANAQPAPAAVAPDAVPDAIKLGPEYTLILTVTGTGTQTYEAKPTKDDPKKFEWVLKAPAAELTESGTNKKVGKHYAGPTFEHNDGSKVVGKITGKAPAPNAADLDWVVADLTSTGGAGALAKAVKLQRVNTKGGKAPATAEAADAGKEKVVPYSTTYKFFAKK